MDSDKFPNHEKFAVYFAEPRISICLGAFGLVWQDVGDDAFVASFRGIIDGGIRSRAEAFDDGVGPAPGRDVLRPSSGIQKLVLSRRHAYFNLITDLKNSTTTPFI